MAFCPTNHSWHFVPPIIHGILSHQDVHVQLITSATQHHTQHAEFKRKTQLTVVKIEFLPRPSHAIHNVPTQV